MKVEDVMIREVITFSPDDPIHQVARTLREERISGAPVMEGDHIVGMISEADIMKLIESHDVQINTILPSPFEILEIPVRMKLGLDEAADNIKKAATATVKEIMKKGILGIDPDAEISVAAKEMHRKKVNRLPVVDENGALIGIVTRGDIIGAL